ncbi:MAG: RIO1 family regulatory kinase/ATPase, partial [Halobacteria archaeon]|nr:RIO1 family regulatory kinase/ATPase [Halobacteria archaeon]
EKVCSVLRDTYGIGSDIDVEAIEGENWLSVPLVVDDDFFVKVITPQNTLTHAFFTGMRNLGVRMSGGGPFFETYDSTSEMARHEYETISRMVEAGINASEPIDVIESDGFALLVLRYLDGFSPLSSLDDTEVDSELISNVFETLRRLHDNGLAHGDFSLENVLVVDDEIYFIDSTKVKEERYYDAVAYDLACALGALASRVGEETVIRAASEFYTSDEIEHALDFLIVVRLRPGIGEGFSVRGLRKAVGGVLRES